MPIYRGSQRIESIYRGATKIGRVYRGDQLVYTSFTPPVVTWRGAQQSSNNLTNYAFNNLIAGPGSTTRQIIVGVGGYRTDTTDRSIAEVQIRPTASPGTETGMVPASDLLSLGVASAGPQFPPASRFFLRLYRFHTSSVGAFSEAEDFRVAVEFSNGVHGACVAMWTLDNIETYAPLSSDGGYWYPSVSDDITLNAPKNSACVLFGVGTTSAAGGHFQMQDPTEIVALNDYLNTIESHSGAYSFRHWGVSRRFVANEGSARDFRVQAYSDGTNFSWAAFVGATFV